MHPFRQRRLRIDGGTKQTKMFNWKAKMHDWTQFTKRVTVHASVEKICRAWMTREGIESWFLRSAETTKADGSIRESRDLIQSGDDYLWRWYGWGDEANLRGKILTANGIDQFQFTFHDPMVVTVRIVNESMTNIVELTQQFIPNDEDSRSNFFVGCGEGWTFYLANLKSVLEGGLDLRNRDSAIKRVINS
jgi:uncharacterized protein YndB with AHSA1/START domain